MSQCLYFGGKATEKYILGAKYVIFSEALTVDVTTQDDSYFILFFSALCRINQLVISKVNQIKHHQINQLDPAMNHNNKAFARP